MSSQSQFLLYTAPDGAVKVDVFVRDETVWLTQKALAELFGIKRPAITKHLGNIFESGELTREATISKMEIARPEGGREVAGQEIVCREKHYMAPASPAARRPNMNSRGWNPRAVVDGMCDPCGVECGFRPHRGLTPTAIQILSLQDNWRQCQDTLNTTHDN